MVYKVHAEFIEGKHAKFVVSPWLLVPNVHLCKIKGKILLQLELQKNNAQNTTRYTVLRSLLTVQIEKSLLWLRVLMLSEYFVTGEHSIFESSY